jgi:hypothetical protein
VAISLCAIVAWSLTLGQAAPAWQPSPVTQTAPYPQPLPPAATPPVPVQTAPPVTPPVTAGCTKDTDCKGDRVCVAGACQSPSPAPGSVAVPTVDAYPASPPPAGGAHAVPLGAAYPATPGDAPVAGEGMHYGGGWAKTAGVLGIVAGATAVSLAAGSAATVSKKDAMPAAPLGGGSAVVVAVMGPLVAAGAASARNNPAVTGSLGLRITGWIGYGVLVLDAIGMGVLGIAGEKPAQLQIISLGVLETATMLCFTVDAFVSAGQASSFVVEGKSRRPQAGPGPLLVPVVITDGTRQRQHSPGLGLAFRF